MLLLAQRDGKIIIHRFVAEEIFLYQRATIAKAQHKITHIVVIKQFHDVPENRPASDFHHRFRPKLGFFTQTRSLTTTQDDRFHDRQDSGNTGLEVGEPHVQISEEFATRLDPLQGARIFWR
jgi:hypothetical protein